MSSSGRSSPVRPTITLTLIGLLAAPALAHAGDFTDDKRLDALQKRVGAQKASLEVPCVDPGPTATPCKRHALDRTQEKLAAAKAKRGTVRFLQLGDSHIASDYITGIIRDRFQSAFGDAGRGFTHIDQRWGYGGRVLSRGEKRWVRDRIVDKDRAGLSFGFSGLSVESNAAGARVRLAALPGDTKLRVYYETQPGGGEVTVWLEDVELARFSTDGPAKSSVFEVALPKDDGKREPAKRAKKGKKGTPLPAGTRFVKLRAEGKKVRLYGTSLETGAPGVLYESIGPVGADAKVYLELGRDSFTRQLVDHAPDVLILMVGGNDALKTRKGWTDLKKVRADHENLIDLLKTTLPSAECVVWGPMDAGDQKGGKVVSKALLTEIRDMQREVAKAKGCAFWDTLSAMGGAGAITKWHAAKVMNADLVHPKKAAADLLGRLAFDAWDALPKR